MQQQHSFSFAGCKKDNAGGFQCPTCLIARGLEHIKTVLGLEAFECGQGYAGVVGERFLRPAQ